MIESEINLINKKIISNQTGDYSPGEKNEKNEKKEKN